jgi:hypothetical protein
VSLVIMAERYDVEMFIPASAQTNRDAWDVHNESRSYDVLQDAFIDVLRSFEFRHGYRVEAILSPAILSSRRCLRTRSTFGES